MPKPPSSPPSDVPLAEDYLAEVERQLDRLPRLAPATDIAAILGVARQSVYHLVHTGELAAVRLNRSGIRVFRESVRDYLRRNLI